MSNLTTSRPEQPATLTPEAVRTTGELGHLPARDCSSWCDRSRSGHSWQIDPVKHRRQLQGAPTPDRRRYAVFLYEWADGSDAPNLQVDRTLGVTTAADRRGLVALPGSGCRIPPSIGGVA